MGNITTFDVPQGSDQWHDLRKGRLTGSKADGVFVNDDVTMVKLSKKITFEEFEIAFKRSDKQCEAYRKLLRGEITLKECTSAVADALVKKELAEKYVRKNKLRLSSKAPERIDKLIVETMFQREELENTFPTYAMERGVELEPLARADYENLTGKAVELVGFVTNSDYPKCGFSPDGKTEGGKGIVEFKCPLPQTHLKYLREGVLPSEYKIQVHMSMVINEVAFCDFYSYCPKLPPFSVRVHADEYTEALRGGLKAFEEMYDSQLEILKKS